MDGKKVLSFKILDYKDTKEIAKSIGLREHVLKRGMYDINMILSEIANLEVVIISAYIGDIIVGSAYVSTLKVDEEEYFLISDIFVVEELRGRKIGQNLLYFVLGSKDKLNSILNKKCSQFILRPTNQSRSFYIKANFEDYDDSFMVRRI